MKAACAALLALVLATTHAHAGVASERRRGDLPDADLPQVVRSVSCGPSPTSQISYQSLGSGVGNRAA